MRQIVLPRIGMEGNDSKPRPLVRTRRGRSWTVWVLALALSIGSAAIEDERPDVALEVLAWAKHEAPRVAPIREAYGVALYLAERFDDALSELQAYRRLTGRPDQNHLIADCLRALGRDVDRIAETAEGLLADTDAPLERRAEAAIVWAAALADADELGPARAVLRRFLESARGGAREALVRARWFAGDLADRAGDLDDARTHLAAVVDVDPGFLDASERLRELDTRRG
jgi:tetratricopeptide (TPR) repeat protein